jgi:hypothetical protein
MNISKKKKIKTFFQKIKKNFHFQQNFILILFFKRIFE